MSGGSFNYVEFKIGDSEIFQALDDLRAMESYLRGLGKHDAADELYNFILNIESCKRYLGRQGERLIPLIHAAEWTASSDWGAESIDREFNKLIGKGDT